GSAVRCSACRGTGKVHVHLVGEKDIVFDLHVDVIGVLPGTWVGGGADSVPGATGMAIDDVVGDANSVHAGPQYDPALPVGDDRVIVDAEVSDAALGSGNLNAVGGIADDEIVGRKLACGARQVKS